MKTILSLEWIFHLKNQDKQHSALQFLRNILNHLKPIIKMKTG